MAKIVTAANKASQSIIDKVILVIYCLILLVNLMLMTYTKLKDRKEKAHYKYLLKQKEDNMVRHNQRVEFFAELRRERLRQQFDLDALIAATLNQ